MKGRLSIDSEEMVRQSETEEETRMKLSRSDVQKILDRMNDILSSPYFNIESNLQVIVSRKDGEDIIYSTKYTLADLEFDLDDVVAVLKTLETEDFSHVLLDKGNLDPPYMLVFSKIIQSKEVYIKIKVRDSKEQVVCISFHYAKHPLNKPYAR